LGDTPAPGRRTGGPEPAPALRRARPVPPASPVAQTVPAAGGLTA
jgi:hypothetical protein